MSLKNKVIFVFNPDQAPSGKSTIALLLANYIHYQLKQNTLLVSCDLTEQSPKKLRNRDTELWKTDMLFKKLSNQKSAKPVLSILETGETNLFHLLNGIKNDNTSTIVIDCKDECDEKVLAAIDTVANFVIIPTDISQFAYKFGCFYAHCFNQITENRQKYMLLRNQVTPESQIDYPIEMYLHSAFKDLEFPEIIGYHPDIVSDPYQYNTYFSSKNAMTEYLPKLMSEIEKRM